MSVSAAPLAGRSPKAKGMGSAVSMKNNTTRSSTTMGAAYFISNEPSGNFVVAADINTDGSLTLSTATFTGGLGQHGNDGGANGPDALFSQGSVKANANASLLAAVNTGSNTVSLFQIDPSDPSNLRAIGAPVSSGGEFPMSLAFNSAGSMLCVLNGGAVNGVQCFNTTDNFLGLKPIANSQRSLGLNQTTPATGPAGSTSHIIFSEDGSSLFAAVKGNPALGDGARGFIAVWDVADDGSLSTNFTNIPPPAKGNLPFALANIPGTTNALFVPDAAVGVDIFDLSQGPERAAESNATQAVPVKGQGAVCWVAHSTKTGTFFVTDIMTALVTEIAVDGNLAGSVVKQYPTQTGAGTIDLEVASLGGNDFLYVNMANATAIQAFSLPAKGQATKTQTLDVAGPVKAAGLSISGANVQGMTVFVKPQ
ncbi:hypothetical protein K488DRAFT_89403 [Vararia minispora EC-137]|uniref:Uncharacterized protein n=1 Tax=Vararia minispora EC-137 TaxID=1314806 RepID=A0ACB8QAD7_9AGAM|nr:hypothetical protein K488DRAFT_89403 [Vararia minispora EC-137]